MSSASGDDQAGRDDEAGTEQRGRNYQAEADRHLAELIDGLDPPDAVLALATLANRTAARLHALGRSEATARKGQAAWPAWASLQNAARTLVLQASTCRDLARRLVNPEQ